MTTPWVLGEGEPGNPPLLLSRLGQILGAHFGFELLPPPL
jgi:hypothetical protein